MLRQSTNDIHYYITYSICVYSSSLQDNQVQHLTPCVHRRAMKLQPIWTRYNHLILCQTATECYKMFRILTHWLPVEASDNGVSDAMVGTRFFECPTALPGSHTGLELAACTSYYHQAAPGAAGPQHLELADCADRSCPPAPPGGAAYIEKN